MHFISKFLTKIAFFLRVTCYEPGRASHLNLKSLRRRLPVKLACQRKRWAEPGTVATEIVPLSGPWLLTVEVQIRYTALLAYTKKFTFIRSYGAIHWLLWSAWVSPRAVCTLAAWGDSDLTPDSDRVRALLLATGSSLSGMLQQLHSDRLCCSVPDCLGQTMPW